MNILDYLIPFIFALGLLIFVHELGHYLVARRCGVKVLRFSIGFGRPLLKWTSGPDRTEWALAAFPLGGYVKMLDEREAPVDPAELHRAFNRQPVGRRFAVVAAGPLANFLLAIVLYWGLFSTGIEDLKARVTLTDVPASIAARAGIREGDLIVDIESEPVRSWSELRWVMLRHALDNKIVQVRVRTIDDVETYREFDFSGVRVDDQKPDLIKEIGLRLWRPVIAPVVGDIMKGGAAERAGVQSGDEFVSLAGAPLNSWDELVERIRARPGVPVPAQIRRAGQVLAIELTPDEISDNGERFGRIGIGLASHGDERAAMFTMVRYGVGEALVKSLQKTWDTSALTLKMMGRMITGDVSWKNLSGPLTIADYAGQSAKLGWSHYLGFVALISISLGVLNLLPIPVLDGGHLLYYMIEIIKGGPVSERVMEIGQQIGLVALAMLMGFAFFNDITRLISG